jgi:hypothetical protein
METGETVIRSSTPGSQGSSAPNMVEPKRATQAPLGGHEPLYPFTIIAAARCFPIAPTVRPPSLSSRGPSSGAFPAPGS